MVRTVSVVVVDHQGKILALQRNRSSGWYPGRWGTILGIIREGETPDECFRRKLPEEVGIKDFLLVEKRGAFVWQKSDLKMAIYPYLCRIDGNKLIKLNDQYRAYRWVNLREFLALDCAPSLETELGIFSDYLKVNI